VDGGGEVAALDCHRQIDGIEVGLAGEATGESGRSAAGAEEEERDVRVPEFQALVVRLLWRRVGEIRGSGRRRRSRSVESPSPDRWC